LGENSLLSFGDAVEDVGLALICSVSTDSEELLVWVGVSLESLVDSNNRIKRSHLDVSPVGVAGGKSSDSVEIESFS
jgi:hypothetical protein